MQHDRSTNTPPTKTHGGNSGNMLNASLGRMSASQSRLTVGSKRDVSNTQLSINGASIVVSRKNNHNIEPTRHEIPNSQKFTSNVDEPKSSIQLTLWFHEIRTTPEDVLVDSNVLPGGVSPGQIYELQSADAKLPKKLVFKLTQQNIRDHQPTPELKPLDARSKQQQSSSQSQISLQSNPFQRLLDLAPRSIVSVRRVTNLDAIAIDSMEIFIKDVNLSRDAMWQFSSSLVGSCCYTEQRLSFLNSRTGIVRYMYKNGKKVFSGYINNDTKIIYRSESAKLTVLIQLSREMWNFEENGEIMFHKLVNNLFPKIFRRWRDKGTHHSITIVLFTSMDLTSVPWTNILPGERPSQRRDYFRVVVDQVNIVHWDRIMANLRLEFANFKRDCMLNPEKDSNYVLEGQMLPSVKGNFLEAVNVALVSFSNRFSNTDLKHSLNHFILITPGTGLFDVDYNLLLETSKKMSCIDTSLDIVCLSQPPLHVTPLFRFIKDGKISHCVPIWCDISFFREKSDTAVSQWMPRCKIYELQMMGVMENEASDARISRLYLKQQGDSLVNSMEKYDESIFSPIKKRNKSELVFNIPEPKFKAPSIKDSKATLSLIFNDRTSLLPTNSLTTNSAAVGTVAHPAGEISALSRLYNINKFSEDKVPESPTESLKSVSRSIQSSQIESFRKDSESPRIIKGETLFSRKEDKQRKQFKEPKAKARNKLPSTTDIAETPQHNSLWIEIANPSREVTNNVLQKSNVSRWSNLFPEKIQRKLIKWRSFQAPAALPITTGVFPTHQELQSKYTFQNYSVYLNSENYLELKSTPELMREMIQLRLMLGFQICYGDGVKKAEVERIPAGSAESIIKYFPDNDYLGSRIYMSMDDEIHRIYCDYNGNINVQLYRKTAKGEENKITLGQRIAQPYFPLIRTRYADDYSPSQVDAIAQYPQKYNWNQFDQFLAGFDDALSDDKKEFHKMKFVVMPAEIPKNAYYLSNEHLNAEEIRVEGLRKLIAVIEKGTYKKEQNKPKTADRYSDVNFYTGNLYDFLTIEAENYDTTGNQPTLMIPENMRFNKSIKLSELATELQNPQSGLKLVDRTWHFKKHLQCFIGSELVTWLVDCFEDIDTREAAVSYGQNLLTKGLFKHVESRHGFIDGYYFYEFEEEYFEKIDKVNRGSWFSGGGIKKEGSITSKSTASPKILGQEGQGLVKVTSAHNIGSEASSMADSTGRRSKKFILSKAVKFDVDPLKKSYRPEVITVHYDRVHNPDHCYHIRLQWLTTTNKFIEDTIMAWSRLCERHGLKLVETPWKELCVIPRLSPFHSFVEVKLSVNPLVDDEFADPSIINSNRYYYHLCFLKKMNFLLDNRATSFFSRDNIDITYSWGRPSFQYAQFIHSTGFYIVELRDKGDFFLAPNNMHVTRVNSTMSPSGDYESSSRATHLDSQKVMLNFRAACQNVEFLRDLFRDAKSNWQEQSVSQIT
ncbi:IML1 [Candida theae]|uniref:Vacuolar membrane-associated protein IML1 n=1 Tax=Candida theae TaxID=1198502 RepID=A0AAD5BJ96_9ASCO|nr:IML1 [Candida theae]KAI5967056.1 IML1 [Candida theae]